MKLLKGILYLLFLTISFHPRAQEVKSNDFDVMVVAKSRQNLLDSASKYVFIDPLYALDYAKSAFFQSIEQNDPEKEAHALYLIGDCLFQNAEIEDALSYYVSSAKKYKSISDTLNEARTYARMASCYRVMGDIDKAVDYFKEAYPIFLKDGDKTDIADYYKGKASIYVSQDSISKAKTYFNKAKQIFINEDDIYGISSCYNSLGVLYGMQQQYDSCIYNLNEAIMLVKQLKYYDKLGYSYLNLSNAYKEQGDYPRAKEEMLKAADIVEKHHLMFLRIHTLDGMSKIEYLLHNYKLSAELAWKANRAAEDFASQRSRERVVRLSAEFELQKKDEQIALINEVSELRYKKNNYLLIIIIALFVVSSMVVLLFSYRNKQLKQKQVAEKKEKELIRYKALQKEKELRDKLDAKNREIASYALSKLQKNEMLQDFKKDILKLQIRKGQEKSQVDLIRNIDRTISIEEDWKDFVNHFEKVHPDFFKTLIEQFPTITQKELKYCAFIRINLNTKEISALLNVTVRAVEKARERLKIKLNLDSSKDLNSFLQTL